MITKKELDMLRFYGGDIRKRTEEGKLLIINSSANPKDPKVKILGVRPQCGQLKPRMLKIQRFWAYILDFFI